MKAITKRILPALFACTLLLFPLSPAQGECAAEKAEPAILSVSGEGSAEAAPDRAVITIGIKTHATDAQEAQAGNAAAAASIQQALKDLGIPDKDMQTRGYSFHPTYHYTEGRENDVSGYDATNSIIVTLRDTSLVGRAIDTALRHGANQISSLSFGMQDSQRLRKDALHAAVRDARDKADIIAASLGRRIIGIKNVSESTGSASARGYDFAMLAKSANDSFDTPIESGTVSLSATVHIDYVLSD